ncbi:hypothetical protein GCM10010503_26980 [Streptomyces lucensis JCM 4490]|uniref:Uncharacterized protein n=1 Tax=Streptomyces lucensis JCM 4490 TaxID=1306176 RepID=A0A918J5D1_9ACTN|nr:hypothetical protein [Streptomyces lucensis]GGW48769.1 hypothetical protein GCM10010503_26980 [Streptomyces lucensis JCM 4490]
MHAYDTPPPRRSSYASVPSARTAQESAGVPSATPIYDALYSEWVKAFRTLPGDRSGEEDLGFSPFGDLAVTTGSYGGHRAGSFSSTYSAYSAGAYSARQQQQQSQWQRVGTLGRPQETGMQRVPAALPLPLPPGPRRGA